MALAAKEGRVLISADTDFGELPAFGGQSVPSVLLLRGSVGSTDARAALILANLESVQNDLGAGAIVVFTDDRIRIRELPIKRG